MKQPRTLPIENAAPLAVGLHAVVRGRSSDKTVNDAPVKVALKNGQIIVENKVNGVLFSFPSNAWPLHWNAQTQHLKRLEWITRLTPFWDDWSAQTERLRESCVKAINKLSDSVPVPLKADTANAGIESPNVGAEPPATKKHE